MGNVVSRKGTHNLSPKLSTMQDDDEPRAVWTQQYNRTEHSGGGGPGGPGGGQGGGQGGQVSIVVVASSGQQQHQHESSSVCSGDNTGQRVSGSGNSATLAPAPLASSHHQHLIGAGGEQCPRKSASLLRLGMLMAITMTLHNLPEGFAVAFSAMTDFGPIMAIAIAVHNIPEVSAVLHRTAL